MNDTLLSSHREFLPVIYKQNELGSIGFSISCTVGRNIVNDVEERKYYWDSFFNIRPDSKPSITLHNISGDTDLLLMEQKLLLLKEGIESFCSTVKKKIENPEDKETFYHRVWLNPEEANSDYTGYLFYRIESDGNSRFFLADCSKSLNFWLDVYEKPSINTTALKTLEVLLSIAKVISLWVTKVEEMRIKNNKRMEE